MGAFIKEGALNGLNMVIRTAFMLSKRIKPVSGQTTGAAMMKTMLIGSQDIEHSR